METGPSLILLQPLPTSASQHNWQSRKLINYFYDAIMQ